MKLNKFYDLLSRSAQITLYTYGHDVHYVGSVKDIPDRYDDWTVVDFKYKNGKFEFLITE